MTLETLKVAIARPTNKSLCENIFRALLSLNPDDYSLPICNKTIHVKIENINENVTPIANKIQLSLFTSPRGKF